MAVPDQGRPGQRVLAVVYPVVVGGGTPFLPDLEETLDLELVETRTFGSRVVSMRYPP
jgi:dihydrofolate reductase